MKHQPDGLAQDEKLASELSFWIHSVVDSPSWVLLIALNRGWLQMSNDVFRVPVIEVPALGVENGVIHMAWILDFKDLSMKGENEIFFLHGFHLVGRPAVFLSGYQLSSFTIFQWGIWAGACVSYVLAIAFEKEMRQSHIQHFGRFGLNSMEAKRAFIRVFDFFPRIMLVELPCEFEIKVRSTPFCDVIHGTDPSSCMGVSNVADNHAESISGQFESQLSAHFLAAVCLSRYAMGATAKSVVDLGGSRHPRRNSAPLSAGAFFAPAVCYGGCARNAFGHAGFLGYRSANPRTVAPNSMLGGIRGRLRYPRSVTHDQIASALPYPNSRFAPSGHPEGVTMHVNHLSPVAQERWGYTPAPAISTLQLDHIRDLIDWVCESSSSAALRPGGVKQALQHRIRAQYGLNHIAELPARHFYAVVAMLEQAKRDCDDFRWHIRKQGDQYIRNVLGGGHPSTSHRRRLSQQETREVRS